MTAAFFNQVLLEEVLGITVELDQIRIDPHPPAAWPGARALNLTVGDSVWDIWIRGKGEVSRIALDGAQTDRLPIEPGRHRVEVALTAC